MVRNHGSTQLRLHQVHNLDFRDDMIARLLWTLLQSFTVSFSLVLEVQPR